MPGEKIECRSEVTFGCLRLSLGAWQKLVVRKGKPHSGIGKLSIAKERSWAPKKLLGSQTCPLVDVVPQLRTIISGLASSHS